MATTLVVGTICLGLWLIGLWPLGFGSEGRISNSDYRRDLLADFKNPACREYSVSPLNTLIEPHLTEPCYHIYTSRKFDNTVPYTIEAHDRHLYQHYRSVYLSALGFGTLATVAISVLVYLVGTVIGWIVRGFRPQP
jgi:hypothetical protein